MILTTQHVKDFFRTVFKVVPGGPAVGTPGANRSAGTLAALDLLAEQTQPDALLAKIDVVASAAAGVQVSVVNDLLVFGLSGTSPQLPAAPANLRVTASAATSLALAWSAGNGTYTLERAPVTGGVVGSYQVLYTGPLRSYTNLGLSANTPYAYRVLVTVGGLSSPYSPVLRAQTPVAALGPGTYAATYSSTY